MRMGVIDTEAKAYLSDRKRFADAFNFSVYDGDEVIRADKIFRFLIQSHDNTQFVKSRCM